MFPRISSELISPVISPKDSIAKFISTEIEWIPLNNVEISKEKSENLINFFDVLDEDDDVQNIYSNAEFAR